MYTIGEFSKTNKITTKALRHYDQIDLLKPEVVDKFTGYRYYSSKQLPVVHKIINLKQMGFSLQEIKNLLDDNVDLIRVLQEKEIEVDNIIKAEEMKVKQIKGFIKKLKEGINMQNVIIKELPKVKIASMRQVIKGYDELFTLCPKIMGPEMQRLGCVCAKPEYCFNIYHDGEYKERNIDVEICEAIIDLKQNSDIVKFKEIDKVLEAACILHKGSYSTLGSSYSYLIKWVEDNGYKILDNPRESYIDGIWNKESEDEWLTEIQVPVTKV